MQIPIKDRVIAIRNRERDSATGRFLFQKTKTVVLPLLFIISKKRCGAPCLTMGKSELDTTHKQYESYA